MMPLLPGEWEEEAEDEEPLLCAECQARLEEEDGDSVWKCAHGPHHDDA